MYSILVVSCDRYSDLWPIFFNGYFKYWDDPDAKIYLGTNFKSYDDPRVTTIKIGEDKEYTTNLKAMLASIETDYVIILVEDIFFSARVDLQHLRGFIKDCVVNKGSYLKLIQSYPLGQPSACSQRIGPIANGVHYRIGIGAALWEKAVLDKCLVFGMSAWDLEKNKNNVFDRVEPERAFGIRGDYSGSPIFKYTHGVMKGAWTLEAIPYLKREGFGSLIKGRETQRFRDFFYCKAFSALMFLFNKFNYKWT